jgi:EAL domain-containing protein (putative c-di-GMP-specific phosphodiesterase class I)
MPHAGSTRLTPGRVRPYVAAVSVRDADLLRVELDRAPGRDRLDVHYQPIMDLLAGELVAVEALARWHHPTRGLLPAAEFVPLAEELGVVHELDRRVLDRACRQVAQWQGVAASGNPLRVSVNLAAGHVARPDFADEVRATVEGAGLDPALVILELGSWLADLTPDVRAGLQLLREQGIRIALSDLGAPGGTLRGLGELPVDVLKLDRRLVADLETSPHAATVADAVLRLGQLLRLDTVATGIENPQQAARLAMLGYATGQGFHFARPIRADQIRNLLTLNSVVSGLAGIRA